jgi:WD40 repeat protein/tRNA A-37 threonylcarbamoyl transferase component Bud32
MNLVCPHCRNPIDLADTPTDEEILCPACGSTFRLHEVGTTAWTPRRSIGRFELLEIVGQGAFGTVYRARDPELDRIVALKVPRTGQLAGAQELVRFAREARSVAQLRHPSIVSVHEVGSSDNVPFLVSEFVEGVTLADWLSGRRPTFREAASWVAELADALHYAHEQGVVHRDVKPSNIMLELARPDPAGNGTAALPASAYRLRVMDFGLARRDVGETTMTTDGQVLGTPAYMSPEQAGGEGHSVDGRSDVYSLGVILYLLLTGELPFRGTPRMLLHQVLHDEPRRPRSLNDHIPRDLETICLKAMAKEPGRRYATAQMFADDLRRFLAGEPIKARPAGRLERAWRWAKRRPAVAGPVAALALVLAIGTPSLGLLAWHAELARRDADRAKEDATHGWNTANERLEAVTAARADAEKGWESAREHLYGAQSSLLVMAWRDRARERFADYLERQKPRGKDPDLRGFEWHYFRHLLEASQITLTGHAGPVTVLAFSNDRKHLASGGQDGVARVWELATRLEVRSFPGHNGGVAGLTFSPDTRRLATVDRAGTVRVWDSATGKEMFSLPKRPTGPNTLAFSPNGHLVVADNARVTVHDQTGTETRSFTGPTKAVTAVACSLDGQRIACVDSDRTVRIWEPASGKVVHSIRVGFPVNQLAFRLNGRSLTLIAPNGRLAWWHPETGYNGVAFNGYGDGQFPIALRRDGREMAHLAPADVVRVIDPESGRELYALRKHAAPITCILFSLAGDRVATASRDGTIKVWSSAVDWDVLHLPGHAGGGFNEVLGAFHSPDPNFPVVYRMMLNTNEVFSVVYSPDGKHLASGGVDGMLHVREAATGQDVLLLRAHSPLRHETEAPDQLHHLQGVDAIAYSRDGKLLASGGADGTVKVWDASNGKMLCPITAHNQPVSGVAFSPDGRLLASSSWDRTVKVWEAATGKLLHTLSGHRRQVSRVAFRPDGKVLASSSWDQTIRLWNPETGQQVRCLDWISQPGRVDPIDSLAFHPSGDYLAAAPDPFGGGGEVKVFDLKTGATVHSLPGHIYGIFQVVFSADGRRFASCSCDGGVKVWDMATGQELLSFDNRTGRLPALGGRIDSRRDAVHSVAFSPDGSRLALGCRNNKLLVLDTTPLTPELLIAREAYLVVHALFDELVTPSAVIERLSSPGTLSEPLRKEALARARRFLQSPHLLNEKSWEVAGKADQKPEAYQRALLQAQEACRLEPGDGEMRNTLGVAQYRTGQWQAALGTLTESDRLQSAQLGGSHPLDLAFLAMTQQQLGQKEKAQAFLGRLRETMKQARWNQDAEAQAFFKEAQMLVQER